MCGADEPGTSGSLHESCSERCEEDRELSLISARGKHARKTRRTPDVRGVPSSLACVGVFCSRVCLLPKLEITQENTEAQISVK